MHQQIKKSRIWELDFLRFAAMILMVVVHYNFAMETAYSFYTAGNAAPKGLGEAAVAYNLSTLKTVMQLICGTMFTVLSAVTTSFSSPKKILYKGVKYLIIAMAITLVTYIISLVAHIQVTIWFGVLHHLSVSMIICSAIALLYNKLKLAVIAKSAVLILLGLGIAVPAFCFNLQNGYIIEGGNGFAMFGFINTDFSSGDYYPLLPWTGVFIIGYGLGKLLYPDKKSLLPALDKKWHKPFTWLGRYSIQFYLIHQVALIGLCFLLMLIIK